MPKPKSDEPPAFDQYYPGGVMKQMADAVGGIVFNPELPGGVIEQLRLATDPDLELDQHGPGGAHGQIGYTIVMYGAAVADVDTVAVTGSQVDLACAEDLPLAEIACTVSYTPGVSPLQGKDGVPVAAFSDFPVAAAP
jgi:hypothetical protein